MSVRLRKTKVRSAASRRAATVVPYVARLQLASKLVVRCVKEWTARSRLNTSALCEWGFIALISFLAHSCFPQNFLSSSYALLTCTERREARSDASRRRPWSRTKSKPRCERLLACHAPHVSIVHIANTTDAAVINFFTISSLQIEFHSHSTLRALCSRSLFL